MPKNMVTLAILLLVLLPTCYGQSYKDCPEEHIKNGNETKDFPLTGAETEIDFSKRNEKQFGRVKFTLKCLDQEEFWITILQNDTEVTQIDFNKDSEKELPDERFFLTNPAKITLSHPGDSLTISILDTKNNWRKLMEEVPGHGNCTLQATSTDHYVVWFPCSESARPNLWYLLLLPVFLALLVVLYLHRKKLMKVWNKEHRWAPSRGKGTETRDDFGSPDAEPIRRREGSSDQGETPPGGEGA